MSEDIEVPVDPEDGLTPSAVDALHTFVLDPDDQSERYDRLDVLQAWLEWCFERDAVVDAVVDLVVTTDDDGTLRVGPASRRRRSSGAVVLSSDLQRSMLDCPLPGDAETRTTIALECVAELLGELARVQADEEKLYGHLALVHRIETGGPDHNARRERHREAHRNGGGFAGHHRVIEASDA